MDKQKIILVKTNNIMTTQYYYSVLQRALEEVFDSVIVFDNISQFEERDKKIPVMVGYVMDAFRLLVRGYRNLMVWVQGVKAEECLLAEQKRIKAWIEAYIEGQVLKRMKFCVFVSEAMRDFYTAKYEITFADKEHYIMPCYNEESIFEEAFIRKENIFVYTGSISKWQCFEEAVKLYREIEKQDRAVSLLVLTPQREKAREIIIRENVERYHIDFVSKVELGKYLVTARYGFVLREDNPVNNVATPTKFSTYCAYGIIPIFTTYIRDFCSQTRDMEYVVALPSLNVEEGTDIVIEHMKKNVNLSDMKREYRNFFSQYYNSDRHRENLIEKLRLL